CDFDFTAEDTISSKTSFLDINADLKLSLFFGWIEVNGSAKYLENHRTFTRQSRVSFKYRCRTHFKELRINELMSEQQEDRQVLDSGIATHVVTGILYGIDAIFMFDRNTTDNEDKLQIQNKLEAMIKFLPKASVTLNTDEHKNKLLDNVKCTYHGDITLDSEPSSFEEAIKVYKSLPSKLGPKAEKCVPMSIWLYPLNKLASKKVTLNEPLHVILINQIQDKLEKIQVLKMKCNDLTARPTCLYDETYRQKVDEMQKTVEQSEQKLKSKLSSEVTAAKSINLVQGNIRNILDEYEKSPKSPEKLDDKLLEMRTVINVFDTCVTKIPSSNKEDNTSHVSQESEQFKLPPIENFVEDLQKRLVNTQTDAQRKTSVRRNISNVRKSVKKDIKIFVSKCAEKEKQTEQTNVSQGADVEVFTINDMRYRQKDDLLTTVEKSEQNLQSQLSRSTAAVSSIHLVKGNADNLLDEHEKSPKSNEKSDNNLSEMRTATNVHETCVIKFPTSYKNSSLNELDDMHQQLSHDNAPIELPLIEKISGDLSEDKSHTTAQRKQDLIDNSVSIKSVKDEIEISQQMETQEKQTKQSFVKQEENVELSSPVRTDQPAVSKRPGKPSVRRRPSQHSVPLRPGKSSESFRKSQPPVLFRPSQPSAPLIAGQPFGKALSSVPLRLSRPSEPFGPGQPSVMSRPGRPSVPFRQRQSSIPFGLEQPSVPFRPGPSSVPFSQGQSSELYGLRQLSFPFEPGQRSVLFRPSQPPELNKKRQRSVPFELGQPAMPFRPDKPSVILLGKNLIVIRWQVPPNLTADYFYEVSYRSVYQSEWTIPRSLSLVNEPSATINMSLNPGTDYVFRVRCKYGGVFGDYSEVSNAINTPACIIL
ncbi:Hypothetical predicted protein, partial [Mytilus galloprovincialis]